MAEEQPANQNGSGKPDSVLVRMMTQLSRIVGLLLRGLFGEWHPPTWLRVLLMPFIWLARQFAAWVVRAPRQFAALLAVLAVLGGGGFYGWRWYQHRPKPVEITFQVQAPALTCFDCESPANQPHPLSVRFSASTAPLALAGKDIDLKHDGIKITPEVAGRWHWDDDHTLRFEPKEDWPVGAHYEVTFAAQGFAAPQARLREHRFEFATQPFVANIANTEFYQDPTTVSNKKVVVTAHFSHPVNPTEFEARIKLHLYNKITNDKEEDLGKVPFTVQYDRAHLNAYIHSETLAVPKKEGRLAIEIEKGVRAARPGDSFDQALTANVTVPGLYSLAIDDLTPTLARDEQDEPKQVLLLTTRFSVLEKDIVPKVHAWLLPEQNPDPKAQGEWEANNPDKPYSWSEHEVKAAVLNAAQPLALRYASNDEEQVTLHSFGYSAPPGRAIYVRVDKGLQSFGGYQLGENYTGMVEVPPYPRELRILHEGTLLAMSGAKKLTVFTRDVPAIRIQIGRVLPHQLQHLVTQSSGEPQKPEFNYNFNALNITEQRTVVRKLPKLAPGATHYETIDFSEYLNKDGADRRGTFLLDVEAWDADNDQRLTADGSSSAYSEDSEGSDSEGGYDESYAPHVQDKRLVIVTDLGFLVKKTLDGSQDVFVQSIHDGGPIAGATVEVLGRNGEPVLNATTDENGHARLADMKSFRREQQPVAYVVRKGGDSTFMPVDRYDRQLDLSRFDIGGVADSKDASRLSAYLFSDRGIYRPGEEVHIGAIVRTQDWSPTPPGLPLVAEVVDPRGQTIKRERLTIGAAGLEDIRFATKDSAPTGAYTINLSIPKDGDRSDLIGSVSVKVQEFQPDRLKMTAALSRSVAQGWISPDDLKAQISLMNLFGAPAENRRITAEMTLLPGAPNFPAYADYEFRDPQAATEGFNDTLPETTSDDKGQATIDLNLKRFAKASYRLHLVTQGFEADGGRGVAAETMAFVSNLPYLIGWKADGDLGFVSRNSSRQVALLAIDPQTAKTAVKGLKLTRIQRKYVSVLTKLNNGTYKYVSKLKELTLDEKPLEIAVAGQTLKLDTSAPGDYAYLINDADGQLFARIDYTVSGSANLTAKLEKSAELKLTLDRKDYAPGDDISVQVEAPYTGAGLITIERDKVYSYRWFKTTTTASMQKIRVPEGLEGNAYLNVTFIRDPASNEIYTSPLSYGVVPFSIDRGRRQTTVKVTAPERIKPGEQLNLSYTASKPSRILLYAVDEGILQVARYKTPDPLGFFFEKRSLSVSTSQILDLILPEFAHDMQLAAPGGDAEGALGRHLNPFKRRTDKPVVWWSGILDADSTPREAHYVVPDSFNGSLRLFAVAVADDSVGVWDGRSRVVGDFVLSPNTPLAVAPGDRFDVSVGVANQLDGSGKDAKLTIEVDPSSHLEVEGEHKQIVAVGEQHEGVVHFMVKARDELGSATLQFRASLNGHSASRAATMSVRPATPYISRINAGILKSGSQDFPLGPVLYPQYRRQDTAISVLPLAMAHGLVSYLGDYPYDCTEQLVSMAMPAIVLGNRPEFGYVRAQKGADFTGLIDELRGRQTPEGAYRYWPGNDRVENFVSAYVQLVLLEASDRGQSVPQDLIKHGNDALRTLARRDGDSLDDERESAYAIYLLIRQGILMADEAGAVQQRMEQRYAKVWRQDVAAAYLAAAYKLMKQDALAEKAIAKTSFGGTHASSRFHGNMTSNSELLFLLSRYFPERLSKLPAEALSTMVDDLRNGGANSLSAATTVLALDAYVTAVGPQAAGQQTVEALYKDGPNKPLTIDGLFGRADFDDKATKLKFSNQAEVPAFYMVEQAGFERTPPTKAITDGLEILREYMDKDDKAIKKVKLGDEVTVHLKFRAIGRSVTDAVLVDLMPGGFEPVIPSSEPAESAHVTGSADGADSSDSSADSSAEGEGDTEAAPQTCECRFLYIHPTDFPEYADLREDRVVAYGTATDDIREFTYHIKATNIGKFTIPPAYGESMYDGKVKARSVAGTIEVVAP